MIEQCTERRLVPEMVTVLELVHALDVHEVVEGDEVGSVVDVHHASLDVLQVKYMLYY